MDMHVVYFYTSTLLTYYSWETGEYHESVGLVFRWVPQARASQTD